MVHVACANLKRFGRYALEKTVIFYAEKLGSEPRVSCMRYFTLVLKFSESVMSRWMRSLDLRRSMN